MYIRRCLLVLGSLLLLLVGVVALGSGTVRVGVEGVMCAYWTARPHASYALTFRYIPTTGAKAAAAAAASGGG